MTARLRVPWPELASGMRFSGVRWTLADQSIVSVCNFLTIYLLARFMHIGQFGLYMIGWISLLFLVSLQTAVITEPHAVLGPKRGLLRYRQLTTVLAAALLAGAVGLGLLLVLAGALTWALVSPPFGQLLVALGVIVVPWMAQEFVRRVLYTRSETRAACFNDAVSYGLQASGIGLAVVLIDAPSPVLAFGVLGVSSLVAASLGVWQIREHVCTSGLSPALGFEIWEEAADFGKWLLARNIVSWSGQYGHNWLLLAMLGPVALGTFKAAEHLLNIVNPLRLAAYLYLPPRGSRVHTEQGTEALRQWIEGVYRLVGGAFVAVILILALLSAPLLDLAYGDKFAGLHLEWVIILGGGAAVINFARTPLEMGIAAMQQSRPLFWIHAWSVPLLFVIGTTLIHLFGIFGLPVSSMIIGGVLLALTMRAFRGVATSDVSNAPAPVDHLGEFQRRGTVLLAAAHSREISR
jgi:O-antigen/teichoic acid export membrane protein